MIASIVRDHLQALEISSELTRWFRREREPQVIQVTPERVIVTLHRAGVNCVLMGTHGINGYRSEPRATQDVDVLVTKKNVRKAIRLLEEEFPHLELEDHAAVARFRDPISQKVVIDLLKPVARAIRIVFRHTVRVRDSHRIPDLEMALASKFVAMIAPNRRPDKRMIDLGDFLNVVETQRDVLDLERLRRLGDMVCPHGGARLLRLVADFDAGREVRL